MNSRAMVRCIHFPSLFTSVCGSDDMRAYSTHALSLILPPTPLALDSPSPSCPYPVFRDRQAGSSGPARLGC